MQPPKSKELKFRRHPRQRHQLTCPHRSMVSINASECLVAYSKIHGKTKTIANLSLVWDATSRFVVNRDHIIPHDFLFVQEFDIDSCSIDFGEPQCQIGFRFIAVFTFVFIKLAVVFFRKTNESNSKWIQISQLDWGFHRSGCLSAGFAFRQLRL